MVFKKCLIKKFIVIIKLKQIKNMIIPIIGIFFCCVGLWLIHFLNFHYWDFNYPFILTSSYIILYISIFSLLFYKKEFSSIFGLRIKGVNKKIVKKSILTGLFIGFLSNIITNLLFHNTMSPLEIGNIFVIVILVTLIAPLVEELMFRGFIQGLLQYKIFQNSFYVPIILSTVLFAISHYVFVYKMGVLQFITTLFFIAIAGFACGLFRAKYNSIVPSIFTHVFFNIGGSIAGIAIMLTVSTHSDINKIYYLNDTTSYNFDLNDDEAWIDSYEKYCNLGRLTVPEAKANKVNGFVPVRFVIDTCGRTTMIRIDSNAVGYKYLGYGCEEEAIRFIKDLPLNKPLIINGVKSEKEMVLNIYF